MIWVIACRRTVPHWMQADAPPGKGTPLVYGEKYYLSMASGNKTYHRTDKKTRVKTACTIYQQSIMDKNTSDTAQYEATLDNGREVIVRLHRWNDLLVRSKNGHCMKKKPFDVVRVEILDRGTQKAVIACQKWQKYLPKNQYATQNPDTPLTIAQTSKAIKNLFRTFDKTPFLPQKCKKGKGRQKGHAQPRRTKYPVLRKQPKKIIRLRLSCAASTWAKI